jgi:hypothetical protein
MGIFLKSSSRAPKSKLKKNSSQRDQAKLFKYFYIEIIKSFDVCQNR